MLLVGAVLRKAEITAPRGQFPDGRGPPCCKGDPARGRGLGLLPSDVSAQRHLDTHLLLCFTFQQGPMLDAAGRCSHQRIVPSFCTNSSTLKAPSPVSPEGFLIRDSSDTHSTAELSPGGFVAGQAAKIHASSPRGSFAFLQPLKPVFLRCMGSRRRAIKPK